MMHTDRRSLFAGTAAAAVAVAIPTSALAAPADRRAWEFALARYRAIEQAAETFDAEIYEPLWEKERAFDEAHGTGLRPGESWTRTRDAFLREHGTAHIVPDDIHDRHERLWEEVCDAAGEVLDAPAPDLPALRWKLDYLTGGGKDWAAWCDEAVQQAMLDMARLLPTAA